MASVTISALLKLPKKRRAQLAQRLWLSVIDDSAPVPAAHKKELDARLEAYRSGKVKAISHSELMKRMKSRGWGSSSSASLLQP